MNKLRHQAGRGLVAVSAAVLIVVGMATTAIPAGAGSGPMTVTTNTTLTEDQQGPITIAADAVTLDCAGHRVTGPGDVGIYLPGRTRVTVKNCQISGFGRGLFLAFGAANFLTNNRSEANVEGLRLEGSSNNKIVGNTVVGNSGHGVALYYLSSGNVITQNSALSNTLYGFVAVNADANTYSGNFAKGNQEGFVGVGASNSYLNNIARDSQFSGFHFYSGSSNNTLIKNLSEANFNGIWLDGSPGNRIEQNTLAGNTEHGLGVAGGSSGNLISHNTARGNTGIGFIAVNSAGNTFSQNLAKGNVHGFVSVGVSNSYIDSTASANTLSGFELESGASSNTLTGNVSVANIMGIRLNGSWNNTVSDNTVAGNTGHGLFLDSGSAGNVITHNTARGNTDIGFVAVESDGNTFSRNFAQGNGRGFVGVASSNTWTANRAVESRFDGFQLYSGAANNTLTGNTAASNHFQGFALYSAGSGNKLIGNSASENGMGFEVADSPSNTFQGNKARENQANGFFILSAAGNAFSNNLADENGGNGFLMSNAGNNTFVSNLARENRDNGFALDTSSGNTLTENSALSNATVGFHVFNGSTTNQLERNVGFGNSLDAEDDNPAGSNQWIDNRFGTAALP